MLLSSAAATQPFCKKNPQEYSVKNYAALFPAGIFCGKKFCKSIAENASPPLRKKICRRVFQRLPSTLYIASPPNMTATLFFLAFLKMVIFCKQ